MSGSAAHTTQQSQALGTRLLSSSGTADQDNAAHTQAHTQLGQQQQQLQHSSMGRPQGTCGPALPERPSGILRQGLVGSSQGGPKEQARESSAPPHAGIIRDIRPAHQRQGVPGPLPSIIRNPNLSARASTSLAGQQSQQQQPVMQGQQQPVVHNQQPRLQGQQAVGQAPQQWQHPRAPSGLAGAQLKPLGSDRSQGPSGSAQQQPVSSHAAPRPTQQAPSTGPSQGRQAASGGFRSVPGQFASTMQIPASPFPYQSSGMATSNSQPATARASQPQPETGGVAMHPSSGSLAFEAGANAFGDASHVTGRAGEVDSRGGLAHDSQANGDRETDPQGAAAPGLAPGGQAGAPAFPPSTRLDVVCNGNRGLFIVERQVIVCLCSQCEARAAQMGLPEMELSPTDFERHSGSCTSKKWKYTVKVFEQTDYGSYPGISVGTWLERNAPAMAKARGKILGYSSIFGDVAPSQPKAISRKPSGKGKGGKKRAQGDGRWKGRGAAGLTRPSADSASPEEENAATVADAHASVSLEGPDKLPAEATGASPTSPSGKKWLTAADSPNQPPLPKPAMRVGPQHQAAIPDCWGPRPPGREEDDPRAGIRGPSTAEAFALAAGYEKQSSDALHIDAVADPEYHPGAAHDVRDLMVERGQRTRRKPRWLSNSVDPQVVANVGGLYAEEPSEGDDQEDGPLSWRPKQQGPKRKLPQDSRDDRKRMRPLNSMPSHLSDSRGGLLRQDSSAIPKVVQWQLLNDGFMRMTVALQGQLFAGALMPQPRDGKAEQAGYGKAAAVSPTSREDYSDSESGGWGASRAPAFSRPSSGWNNNGPAGTENGGAAMSDGPEVESYRGAAPKPSAQPKVSQNRRILASQDYERMQANGPPLDARCALCHQLADPEAKGVNRTEEAGDNVDFEVLDRREMGLGPFLLVRVSAIMNAWVHMQCALWSPEVYVSNNGSVERASEAVRRGRMIKCKLCGEKGATLGCHKRSCRASFHLSCARDHGCLLQGAGDDPYLVTCREHAEIRDEMELVPLMPLMPDQKVRVSPPEHVPTRPRNARTEVDDAYQPEGKGSWRQSGWNALPKMSTSLDTLSAAALVAKSPSNVESAANPLAAQHFGGTVGQSVLRPGRCAVCVVQRKGVCGTMTAPKKCLRRIALSAAGREIPDAPPGWRTRRPVAHWPAAPQGMDGRSLSPGTGTPGSDHSLQREESPPLSDD